VTHDPLVHHQCCECLMKAVNMTVMNTNISHNAILKATAVNRVKQALDIYQLTLLYVICLDITAPHGVVVSVLASIDVVN